MSGACKYHSHANYKATHLTRDYTLSDQLAMENATKPNADANRDDDENPPPPAGGAGNAGRGASGIGGASKAFPR